MGAALSNSGLALSALCTVIGLGAWAVLWLKRRSTVLPDVSVPEATMAFGRGKERFKRAACARALCSIINGEVQVLEEVLDESQGKHPEFGGVLPDGRGLLSVTLDDLAATGPASETEAFADLLLACTAFDAAWDETDEWNALTMKVVKHLKDDLHALDRIAVLERQAAGSVLQKAAVLRQRLHGDRTMKPESLEGSECLDVPMMLSMNTRVQCPVCMTMRTDLVRCPTCRNVGYCSARHLQADVDRHQFWCN
ncbi:unnamed protein product [Cladocopium goreaui]|uniref:MYND-type domain-containing protein n=1 Tax=Cladocopium goreaui TaxID=2562237 RepID=A0A9P1D3H3_9DINO|nr:unnamed protein product [Cladocopium goreaui]